MPGYADLTLLDGRRNVKTFTWQTTAGAPLNLTGSSAEFHVLDLNEVEVFSCTLGDGTVALGTDGKIVVDISQAKSTGHLNQKLQYGLIVTDSQGVIKELLVGNVAFKKVGQV